MENQSRLEKLVAEAKRNITEVRPTAAENQLQRGDPVFIDVREESDWREGHIRDARHLNRSVIELEIEEQIPDVETPIICYCGGGSRSALVAESLQKMGYKNVRSMTGGFKAWKAAGLPTVA